MLNKSEILKNNEKLVTKIEGKSLAVIEVIKRNPSKKTMKILHWLNQKPIYFSNDVPFLAFFINTIYNYFSTKTKNINDQKTKNLIENCIYNLIINFNCLPKEEILNILSCLNRISVGEICTKLELEKLKRLEIFSDHFFLYKNVSTQLIRLHEKSKLIFNTLFNCQSNPSLNGWALEPASLVFGSKNLFFRSNSDNFLEPKLIKNTSPEKRILRRKAKVRIILFGDDGIGYEYQSPQRLKKILEKKHSLQMLFKKKSACLSELSFDFKKDLTQEELEKKIEKKELELELFVDKEEVFLYSAIDSIQEEINQCKLKLPYNNYFLSLLLPDFEMMQESIFLNNFTKTINYDEFKKLIKFSENILFAINKVKKTIKKIDLFSKSLGIYLDYTNALDDCSERMERCINKKRIIKFFELALNLFKNRALTKHLNYCLFYTENIKEMKISQEPSFLNLFIENNNPRNLLERHFEYLNGFFEQNNNSSLFKNKYLEKNNNYFKVFLNFLSIKYYFVSVSHKNFFVKKFLLSIYQHSDFELIKNEIFKLKWWHFILAGMSPYHVFKRQFKARLAEELFLNLIEEEFRSINLEREPYIKSIDALYSIQTRLKASRLNTKTELRDLYGVNALQSRQEIIDKLSNHEEIKNLLAEVQLLTQNANRCISQFSGALRKCQRESEQSLYVETSSPNRFPSPNNSTTLSHAAIN